MKKVKMTAITKHGMGEKIVSSKNVAQAIAEKFGKDIPQRNGFTVALTTDVSMSNKTIGNSRRTILVGTPHKISEFVRQYC